MANTEMTATEADKILKREADEILERESKINHILKKHGNAFSSTGFSAFLFVKNATEVKHILSLEIILNIYSVWCHDNSLSIRRTSGATWISYRTSLTNKNYTRITFRLKVTGGKLCAFNFSCFLGHFINAFWHFMYNLPYWYWYDKIVEPK